MRKDFAWLTAVAVGAWVVLGSIAWLVMPGDNWLPSGVALVICLTPALAMLAVLNRTERSGPVVSFGAVLIAPLVRLVAVTMLGFLVSAAVPEIKAEPIRFLAWATVFYLLTLTTETYLLLPNKRTAAEPTTATVPNP